MTVRPYTKALDRLKSVGLRPTRQRLGLGRLLFEGGDRHVTAEELHGQAVTAGLRVSLATVYNTLNLLAERGVVRQLAADGQRTWFDSNVSPHFHFQDVETGALSDIAPPEVQFERLPPPPPGMEYAGIELFIRLRRV